MDPFGFVESVKCVGDRGTSTAIAVRDAYNFLVGRLVREARASAVCSPSMVAPASSAPPIPAAMSLTVGDYTFVSITGVLKNDIAMINSK